VPAFQLRINFQTGSTTVPFGTVIDHWVLSPSSGPATLPSGTVAATQQYVTYTRTNTFPFGPPPPGTYVVSAQAYDASNNLIGNPIPVSFTVPDPIGLAPTTIPVTAKIVGAAGANTFVLRFVAQSLGNTGQTLDHTVVTLTGPVNTSQNLPAGQQTLTFSGMINGDYSCSLQSVDILGANIGPPMTGRLYYFDDTQVPIAPLVATTPAIALTIPYTNAQPGL